MGSQVRGDAKDPWGVLAQCTPHPGLALVRKGSWDVYILLLGSQWSWVFQGLVPTAETVSRFHTGAGFGAKSPWGMGVLCIKL